MVTTVEEWVMFLRMSGGLIGIPLALAGLVLVAGGWRFWKVAVVLSFGVVGAVAGWMVAGDAGREPHRGGR